jgi:hypothetical protein
MFLKPLSKIFYRVSNRLALAYLIFIIPSYIVLCVSLYYLASSRLAQRDRDVIENRSQLYQELIDKSGIEGLEKIFSNPKLHSQSLKFLIHIYDQSGKTVFLHLPAEWENLKLSNVTPKMMSAKDKTPSGWFFVSSDDGDEDAFEVKNTDFDNGYGMQVGASTNERDEFLDKFREISLGLLIPLVLFSIFFAIFIAGKVLAPLKNLSRSIREIKAGQLSVRAPIPKQKDELYD